MVGIQSGTIHATASSTIVPFSLTALVTGLTVNTAYWIDVGALATTAGTTTLLDVAVSAFEVM